MATEKKGITVTGVEVSNFHRLTFARVKVVPGVGLVRITGKNRSGKTSLLRGIRAALGGASEVRAEPLHEGAETGRVRLTLSNGFTVGRRFTPGNPKGYLSVIASDGGEFRQGKLDEWLGPLSFDPLALFDLTPARQREILLSVGGDPELPAKVEALRKEKKERYEARTPWISQKRAAMAVKAPPGERPQPVDISAELRRMGELQAVERERGDLKKKVEEATRRIEEARRDIAASDEKIAVLEKELTRQRTLRGARLERLDRVVAEHGEAELLLTEALDPAEEMEQVKARIGEADQVNAALEPWKAWDRAQDEASAAGQQVDALTSYLDDLEQRERALISGAGIPVDGLTFDAAGAPILNGRPLEVASGAERIRLAVAVALAANPDLRVCLVDEANDIDLEGLQELDRLAREHGFQVWAARLGLEGPGEIVVEDGEARARDDDGSAEAEAAAAASDGEQAGAAEAMARAHG